jgi:hypothetical protein
MAGLRKRKREDVEDDYSAGIEGEISNVGSGTKKNTMDSDDEEDLEDLNKKKHDVLDAEEIEGKDMDDNGNRTIAVLIK